MHQGSKFENLVSNTLDESIELVLRDIEALRTLGTGA
jgi:hypothetical protein